MTRQVCIRATAKPRSAAPSPSPVPLSQHLLQIVHPIRPVLPEAVGYIAAGELGVLHCYRALVLSLRHEADGDDAAVRPVETHRFRRRGGSNLHPLAIEPPLP